MFQPHFCPISLSGNPFWDPFNYKWKLVDESNYVVNKPQLISKNWKFEFFFFFFFLKR